MNVIQVFREALQSLAVNKLRSALTVLGIVIGVAAVIAMLAIGRGAQVAIDSQINSIGTNLIFLSSGAPDVRNPRPLTLGDASALADRSQAPSIRYVAPVIQGRTQVSQRGEQVGTSLLAITPDYAIVRNQKMAEGQFISDSLLRQRAAVAVLGSEVAKSLYGRTTNLEGQIIRIDNQPFRVIGVLESKGGSNFGSQDDQVLIPLTTAQSRLLPRQSRDQVDMIYVQAAQANQVDQAVVELTQILTSRHRTSRDQPDFSVLKQQDILAVFQSITSIMTLFLGGIGGISLLVGGIGIMNIMYVTVTERTREIGLRKAIGAKKRDILIQFLSESALLSLIGGVLGIGVAWVISWIVGLIATRQNVDFAPVIQPDAILLATLFSAAVGLFFGFYPARRAANLEPVEALRYE